MTGDGSPGKPEQPGDVVGFELDVLHVGRTGADVLRGDVAAAQRLDEAAVSPEQRLPVAPLVVADDDRLAAAEVDSCDGRLVRHSPREPERVGDGLVRTLVLPEAGAAEGWTQCRIMDGDDAEVSARGIVGEQQLLMTHGVHGREYVHGCPGRLRAEPRTVNGSAGVACRYRRAGC